MPRDSSSPFDEKVSLLKREANYGVPVHPIKKAGTDVPANLLTLGDRANSVSVGWQGLVG